MQPDKILVVDDEVDFLETLVKRLQRRDFEARGATSGETALALLNETDFDVVVLDIKMPGGMDGIDVLREIKRRRPETEVLLLTGHASVETSIEGMHLGAGDYLLKPIRFEELLKKLAAALARRHEKRPLHRSHRPA